MLLEIDFYIKNSQDDLSKKIQNVLKLYDINATRFDFAQDISHSVDVSKEVLLITKNKKSMIYSHLNYQKMTLNFLE